jgi:hypothetical protein
MPHPDWSRLRLGDDEQTYEVDDSQALCDAVAALAGQARRRIDVLTPDLEATLYDTPDFLEAVRSLAIASSRTHLRFLVGDSQHAVKNGHRLIELARRLSTPIDLKQPGPATELGSEAFLLADDRGVFWRADVDKPRAHVCFNDPIGTKRLRQRFEQLWEESLPDPEMRRLHV